MCGKDDPNKLVCFEKFQVRPESNLFTAQPVLCVLPGCLHDRSIHNNKDHRGQVIFSNSELEQEEESKRLK